MPIVAHGGAGRWGGREAEQYDHTAKAYRERARELLTSIPDPDGSMAKQVDNCNVP